MSGMLSNLYKLQAKLYIFSIHNKLLPEKFQVMFHKNSAVYSYQIRQANPVLYIKYLEIHNCLLRPKNLEPASNKTETNPTLKTCKAHLKTRTSYELVIIPHMNGIYLILI